MSDDPLFLEVDCTQLRKAGQQICGDAFLSARFAAGNRVISVLSDGLNSGVKANILSSMTATMALKFAAANRDLVKASGVMMDALPVCRLRRISYATFSIVDASLPGHVRVVEMGNPDFLLLRDGRSLVPERRTLTTPRWRDRIMRVSEFESQPGDRIVVFSDGVTQAGLGNRRWKLGWRIEGCRDFILQRLDADPTLSARRLARLVAEEAARKEPGHAPQDDISCAVLYFRPPRRLLVVSGPPFDKDRDRDVAYRIGEFPGQTAICGGTTANIVARMLNRDIRTRLDLPRGTLPPISTLPGIDLVTEGILTLTCVARLLEEGGVEGRTDAAGNLAALLIENDRIDFLVGTRINEAHQDPTLPIDLEIRRNIIKRIAGVLTDKFLKTVSIQYI